MTMLAKCLTGSGFKLPCANCCKLKSSDHWKCGSETKCFKGCVASFAAGRVVYARQEVPPKSPHLPRYIVWIGYPHARF